MGKPIPFNPFFLLRRSKILYLARLIPAATCIKPDHRSLSVCSDMGMLTCAGQCRQPDSACDEGPLAAQVLGFPTQTNLSGWNFSLLILHGKEELNLFRLGWDFIFHLGLARLDFHDLKVALVHFGESVCPCLLWRSVPCTMPRTVPIPAAATNVLLSGAVW